MSMLAIYQEIVRIAQAEFSDVVTNTTYIRRNILKSKQAADCSR